MFVEVTAPPPVVANPAPISFADVDTATTVPVGMIEERTEQLLRVTETALERAIKTAMEGAR